MSYNICDPITSFTFGPFTLSRPTETDPRFSLVYTLLSSSGTALSSTMTTFIAASTLTTNVIQVQTSNLALAGIYRGKIKA